MGVIIVWILGLDHGEPRNSIWYTIIRGIKEFVRTAFAGSIVKELERI
jgi:hypothetical protein